ncbi:hypothetical protein [Synechococcus sp. WH 8016]|jgi:hypothetical protein|uniref:hypothetical protein n=1 Tax=Synechococcus sp. WH 8016 TaxID=166318 RepID=UPI00022D8B63|nr:hypothetical protein [Synechococcus sp. WH 8016]EHA62979.1 hypothetical protein Syn8016DRAFT_0020 [Synechococcus sp. WH 8016]
MSRLPVVIAVAAVASVSFSPAHASKWVDEIIFGKCAEAMNKEYMKAGKQLLLSKKNETCNCVVKEMDNHKSIEEAKNFCIK